MRTSLTGRLVYAADDLRILRDCLHKLAASILTDSNGISTESYTLLCRVFERVGGMASIKVDATDGRFYIPEEV